MSAVRVRKLGQCIGTSDLTLVEEGCGLPGHPLSPFDREGIPRQRVPLVVGGELQSFLFDAYDGRAAGRPSTGHASGGPGSMPSVGAGCLSLAAGTSTAEELCSVKKGVYRPISWQCSSKA